MTVEGSTIKIYDISMPLRAGMPVYPGDKAFHMEPLMEMAKGDFANLTSLALGSHSGTHVDAPSHFIEGGRTIEEMSLSILVGPAHVLELPHLDRITAEDLDGATLPYPCNRLLLKTKNSSLCDESEFRDSYSYLTADAAHWLLGRGCQLIGIDYLSIEEFRPPRYEVHKVLLDADVVILEGLDLRGVTEGSYFLVCLPMKLVGGDGAPARTVLLKGSPY